MPRKSSGNPPGPVPKEIDWKQFEQLCAILCTQSEIASFLKVDEDTIRVRVEKEYGADYSVVYKRFSESGHCSLRRNQYVLSQKNAAMAIWLGKQWLGQKDNDEDKYRYPPNHDLNDKDIEIAKLQAKLDAILAKTGQVDIGSDPQV